MNEEHAVSTGSGMREVPVDWEALEDAFENNAPEVHSYLHLATGEVLRIVDGIADPQMHARIAADINYVRVDPVSSREQYRWMERFIPMVDDPELRSKLTAAIDGKGAFRRFKDVLMAYGPERERWFAFRSERLRIFMEAWLNAHALSAIPRTPAAVAQRVPEEEPRRIEEPAGSVEARESRRMLRIESLRKSLREIADSLGPRDLETLASFAEFLKAKRSARAYAASHHSDPFAERDEPSSDPGPAHEHDASMHAAGGDGIV